MIAAQPPNRIPHSTDQHGVVLEDGDTGRWGWLVENTPGSLTYITNNLCLPLTQAQNHSQRPTCITLKIEGQSMQQGGLLECCKCLGPTVSDRGYQKM